MQKIAILVNTLQSGGAEKQSIFLLNALESGFKVYFIIFYGGRVENKLTQLIGGDNYSLVRMDGHILKKLSHLYKLFKLNKINYLFCFLTKPNFYGTIIGSLAGVNNIYCSIRTSRLPRWKIVLEKIVSNFLATATIFNSHAGEIVFKGKGIRKTIVIPNCFPDIDEPYARVHKRVTKIITLGRFVEEKDYFTALRAIKILKEKATNFVFQIIGYGQLEKQIRHKIMDLDLAANVEIFLNPENIPEFLIEADIYLSTSVFEGTSNSIMEAMNASLPIVATNVGDNDKLILHGINGFLNNVGDHNAIARSLEILNNDYEMRLHYGLESNRILKENFSFEKFKDNYLKVIKS